MNVLRNIAAVVAGVLAGGMAVAVIEGIAGAIFPIPIPPDQKGNIVEWLKTNMDKVPFEAMLLVTLAWFAGTLVATVIAGLVAGSRKLLIAFIAGDLMLIVTLINLFSLPHPEWMWPAGIMAVVTAQGMTLVAGFVALGWRMDR